LKSSCLTPLPSSAVKFYQKACDLNDGSGCSLLGFKYVTGKDVKQDDFKALKFFQKACDLNVEQPPLKFKSHAFWKNLSALKSSCLTPLPL
jgi:TPR repeat protein